MISLIPDLVEALLIQYDFDLGCDTAEQLVSRWQSNYKVEWLPLAVVEALYLGRYKAISVQQILIIWQRRGQPVYHFNSEFQNIITRNILTNLISQADTQNSEEETTPSASESESPEFSKAESTPSNPLEPKSTKVTQDSVEQISRQPAQYNIKHTDFYTKLKAFAGKSENLRSHIPLPKKVQQKQPSEEEESLED